MKPNSDPGDSQEPAVTVPRRGDPFLGWLLLASAVLLILGWTLPVMSIKTLYFFNDELSILQAMLRLWESGETLLFLIVVIFTLAFPLLKLGVALFAWRHLNSEDPRLQEALNWIEHLGRWSMLDVFVTALVIVVVKISYVSDATVHFGLYVFAAAVILSMITIRRVAVRARAESKASNTVTSKTHPERHG